MHLKSAIRLAALTPIAIACGLLGTWRAFAAEPIKIGFSMAQTGAYAGNGKAALLAMNMWEDDQNAKGGLLGRPVKLIYYDDQSSPAQVPPIYAKLIDIDKVDLIVSGYGTNVIAAAMPTAIRTNRLIMGIFGLAVNEQLKYDKYFQIQPNGPTARLALSEGFLDAAMSMDPKPKTIAILATDSEFPNTAASGAREWASKLGLKLVYDRTFPPTTVDFTAVVRGVQASNPDVFFISCFPPETVGIISAVNEIGYKPRLMGGGMVGPQYSAVKQKLGPLLNGVMTFEDYVPELTANFEGIKEFLARYQPKAVAQGTDVLGFYLPPYAYAALQILGGAVEGTKGTDQNALGKYIHANVHKTVVGDIKFGANGEWAEARLFQVLYQGIVGNNVEQFKQAGKQVILHPPKYKSGTIIYPYPGAPQVILAMQGRSGGGGSVGRRGT